MLSHSPLPIQSSWRLTNARRSEIGSENRGHGCQCCVTNCNENFRKQKDEQPKSRTHNPMVAGSNPASATTYILSWSNSGAVGLPRDELLHSNCLRIRIYILSPEAHLAKSPNDQTELQRVCSRDPPSSIIKCAEEFARRVKRIPGSIHSRIRKGRRNCRSNRG